MEELEHLNRRKRRKQRELQEFSVYSSQLRRSGIFVELMNDEFPSEPRRGGIVTARGYAAPTELTPLAALAYYKHVAPPALGERW
jgi:hypothetical protein